MGKLISYAHSVGIADALVFDPVKHITGPLQVLCDIDAELLQLFLADVRDHSWMVSDGGEQRTVGKPAECASPGDYIEELTFGLPVVLYLCRDGKRGFVGSTGCVGEGSVLYFCHYVRDVDRFMFEHRKLDYFRGDFQITRIGGVWLQ